MYQMSCAVTGPVDNQPYPMRAFSEYKNYTLETLLWNLVITFTKNSDQDRISIFDALHCTHQDVCEKLNPKLV